MLRRLGLAGAGVFGVIVVLALLQAVASESGEVVVLLTRDAVGKVAETRLWVVDHDGSAWLRAGNPKGGWFARLVERPEIEVVRAERSSAFRAEPDPAARDAINALMREKYGWADRYIDLVFPGASKIPIRLVPR